MAKVRNILNYTGSLTERLVVLPDLDPADLGQPPKARWTDYAAAFLLVLAVTGVALLGRNVLHLPDVVMLFLLAIMIAAFKLELGPSLAVAALSVATYDFFFVPPYYTFTVEHARHILTFGMMFGLGVVVNRLASGLRRQQREARTRQYQATALSSLNRDLVGAQNTGRACSIVAQKAAEVFHGPVTVLLAATDRSLKVLASTDEGRLLTDDEWTAARWAASNARSCGYGTEVFPGLDVTFVPLVAGIMPAGVVVFLRPELMDAGGTGRDFVEAFARQAAFAIERVRLAEQARDAEQRARAEEIRNSLLSAVSHDLRSPLSAIAGAAAVLRDDGSRLEADQRKELLDTVCSEAERMDRLVGNVLNIVRIESGGIMLRREWVPLEEVVGTALSHLETALQDREVGTLVPEGLPLVHIDPVLIEQVLVNLLDNSLRHTPGGSPLEIGARSSLDRIETWVADRGPGIPPADLERIFDKGYRGAHAGSGGFGLGLPICRGIMEAHGGGIFAENRVGGGTIVLFWLPLEEPPSTNLPEAASEEET